MFSPTNILTWFRKTETKEPSLHSNTNRSGNAPRRISPVSIGTPSDLSENVLSSQEHLSQLPGRISKFRPDIAGDALASKLCPVILDTGKWIVLVTPDYLNSDSVEKVKQRCAKEVRGEAPQVFAITPMFLLTLREGATRRVSEENKSNTAYKESFREIIAWGIRNNASDVHLNIDDRDQFSQVSYSIDGKYISPARWRVPTVRLKQIVDTSWQDSKGGSSTVFDPKAEQQCRVELTVDNSQIMGRWASMATDRGPSVCLRLLRLDDTGVSKSLSEEGFLPSQVAMFERAQLSEGGSVILAGVVGSGKSTTIRDLLSSLPQTRKVITLEDPVEYRIPNALQNTISRNLEGNDDDAFTAKLKTIKRSAPHDLLLGEIRDIVTGRAFQDIVTSGTNVYTTVHAKSHFQIPERLASSSIGIPNSLLASPGILNLLVFQALIPVLCPHCSMPIDELSQYGGYDTREVMRPAEYWKCYLDRISRLYKVDSHKMRIRNIDGCEHCRRKEIPELNGYCGRTVVAEMIEPNADRDILRHIKNGDTISLQEHLERAERTSIDDPDMTNKSILECALYKALQGSFDPRDIETRTRSFETDELIKRQYSKVH